MRCGGGWLDWRVILMSWVRVKVSIESNCQLRTESNQIKIDIQIPLAVGSRFCGFFVRLGVQSSWALAKVPPSELLILE